MPPDRHAPQEPPVPGGFDGLAHPRLHDGPRDTPGLRIFTVAFDDVLQILKLGPIHKAAHRQFLGITVHAHIEGPSELKLKPRSAESIWSEETPMSMRAPSTGIPADPVQRRFEFTVAGVHEMDAIPERSQTDTRKLKGLRVPVQTAQKPSPPVRSMMAKEWPPMPTVPSR